MDVSTLTSTSNNIEPRMPVGLGVQLKRTTHKQVETKAMIFRWIAIPSGIANCTISLYKNLVTLQKPPTQRFGTLVRQGKVPIRAVIQVSYRFAS